MLAVRAMLESNPYRTRAPRLGWIRRSPGEFFPAEGLSLLDHERLDLVQLVFEIKPGKTPTMNSVNRR